MKKIINFFKTLKSYLKYRNFSISELTLIALSKNKYRLIRDFYSPEKEIGITTFEGYIKKRDIILDCYDRADSVLNNVAFIKVVEYIENLTANNNVKYTNDKDNLMVNKGILIGCEMIKQQLIDLKQTKNNIFEEEQEKIKIKKSLKNN